MLLLHASACRTPRTRGWQEFRFAIAMAAALLLAAPAPAGALPMFARKYGLSCSVCHTSPPRLTETGRKFRSSGFRPPPSDGADEKTPFKFFDYASARVQARLSESRSRAGVQETTVNELKFQALELYPLTGAWGRHLSSNIKVTFSPNVDPQIENAYLRVNTAGRERFFVARAGIFHPFDGYGASDSPATITRPLFQGTPANFNQTTFFRTWGFDELGAEAGFDYGRTSLRATILNGLVLHEDAGRLTAFAAQGGPLTRSSALPGHNFPDIQLFVNHTLHPDGGGVSLHYYHGNLALPVSGAAAFRNTFDRVAVYASYPAHERLHLFAGFQNGRDGMASSGRFGNRGLYAEAAVPIVPLTAAGVRYDWFDPARNKLENEIRGVTTYVNAWFREQFRIVAEYQHKHTRRGALPTQKDDALQVRFIFIK